jgi:hypothetical protein
VQQRQIKDKTMLFYVGLHMVHHARHFDRACLSIRRLRRRRDPIEGCRVMLDSGAFRELELYGRYQHSPQEYADQVRRLHNLIDIEIAVAQDFMCEPFMLARTGLTIAEHQRLTIERYDALMACRLPVPIMPVLQGYSADDYCRHVEAYGNRLKSGQWTGLGSVCKRQGRPETILHIVERIARLRPDLRLHGFGVKITALLHPGIRAAFHSADSMAWSFHARRQSDRPSARNDWREARSFAERVQTAASLAHESYQMMLL